MTTAKGAKRTAEAAMDATSWTNLERLILSQAVYEFGADNMQRVATLMSAHAMLARPKNFFTVKSCSLVYEHLMEENGITRPEPAGSRHAAELKRLATVYYQKRTWELRQEIEAEEAKFKQIVTEIDQIRAGLWDDKIRGNASVDPVIVLDDAAPPEPQDESVEADNAPTNDAVEAADAAAILSDPHPNTEALQHAAEERAPTPREEEAEVPAAVPEPAAEAVDEPVDEPAEEPVEEPVVEPAQEPEEPMAIAEDAPEEDVEEPAEEPPATPPEDTAEPEEAPQEEEPPVEEPEAMDVVEEEKPEEAAEPDEVVVVEEEEALAEHEEETVRDADEETPRATQDIEMESSPEGEPLREVGKRKASEALSEASRDRKRAREDSEAADEDDSGPSTSRSGGGGARRKPQGAPDKKFQHVINMVHSQISAHRYGNIFHNPIKKQDASDYHDIVKRPMDLKTIKARVKEGTIANSLEFQRDVYLMFANAMVYNRPGSEIHAMAEEMMTDAENHINNFRQTEGWAGL